MKVICLLLPSALHSVSHTNDEVQALAEICWRYTPVIALGSHWLFLNVEGCEKLYSVDSLLKRLQVHCKRLNLPVKIGLGSDPATALAFANLRSRQKNYLPIDAIAYYMNPFVMENHSSQIRKLQRLGIRVMNDLSKIPRASILRRFGPQFLQAVNFYMDGDTRPWPKFEFTETVQEKLKIDFTDRIQNIEPLLFLLNPVLEKIGERLKSRGQALLSFQFYLAQETSAVVEQPEYDFKFELAQPQNKTKLLLPIIKERLEKEFRLRPLETLVSEGWIKVLSTAPLQHGQSDFLRQQEERMKESLEHLVLRLTERLGLENVFKAVPQESHIPEKTWERKGLLSKSPIADWVKPEIAFANRPLRILPSPVAVDLDKHFLRAQGRTWQVAHMQGPERINTEWWIAPVDRDYFSVWTTEGEKLWIFLSRTDNKYYLHGLFD